MKQYSIAYQALQERDKLLAERKELERQKDSLNIEISTLLDLKKHYAEQAKAFQAESEERQKQLDTTYIRARFAIAETSYALSHIEGWGPGPAGKTLDKLKEDLKNLPQEIAQQFRDIIQRYIFAVEIIGISQRTLAAFNNTLSVIPASDWAVKLEAMPSGAVISDRNIMVLRSRKGERYYDVDEGRFLSEDEVKRERR